MKERLMTRSGQYYGNPLNKYHSWGMGGGGYYTKFYTCYLLSKVQPLALLYTIFDRKGDPFCTPSIDKWYSFHVPILSLCNRTTELKPSGRQNVCSGLFQTICLKKGEVWRKFFSNIVILTFVTQGVPSSFLFRSIAHVH